MLRKSLIQFSVGGWGCVSSLLFDLRPNYGGSSEDNGDLLQKVPCTHSHTQFPRPCSRPAPIHASTRDSWILTGPGLGQSLVRSLLLPPWVLVHTRFCLCPLRICFPILWKLCDQIHWPPKSTPLPEPQVGKSVMGPRTLLTVWEFLWYNFSAVCGLSAQQLYGGVNDNTASSKKLCDPGSCTQSPSPCSRPQMTRPSAGDKRRCGSVSVGSLGPGARKVLFEPSDHLWQVSV